MKRLIECIALPGLVFFALVLIQNEASAQAVFISEIHYDNTGADVNEAVEIFAPAGTNLNCYSLVFYNGADGLSYITQALSGIVDDEGCGYGALSFNILGIQNGAPDGIALYNTCTSTLVQFLSYEGSFTANAGVANGVTSTNIGVSESGSEPVGQSLQLTGSGTTYGSFSWNSPSAASMGTINTGMDPCGCLGPVAEPTTETTADAASSACGEAVINWTASSTADNVIVVVSTSPISSTPSDGVAYTPNSVYGSGETIGANQYVVFNGSGTSVSLTGLTVGTTYYYTIFGYDGAVADCEENYLTGGNTGSFIVSDNCSQITALLINSCNGGINEGTDEIIVIENGDMPINIDDMIIDLPNSTWCNSGCGGNTIVNNPTYVSDLNTMAGCSPDLFVYADPIPAGATVMIFTGDPPSTIIDYSANCTAPNVPVYVIFLNNSSGTGNFANTGTGAKVIAIDFGNGQTDAVSYIPDDVDQVDGGSIGYDADGNPTYYTSTDCVYPLSAQFKSINAVQLESGIVIKWELFSEKAMVTYTIERAMDGNAFVDIKTLNSSGGSDGLVQYSWIDSDMLSSSLIYYRVRMTDEQGRIAYSPHVSLLIINVSFNCIDKTLSVLLPANLVVPAEIRVLNLSGQVIHQVCELDGVKISVPSSGIYFLEIPALGYRVKVVCI